MKAIPEQRHAVTMGHRQLVCGGRGALRIALFAVLLTQPWVKHGTILHETFMGSRHEAMISNGRVLIISPKAVDQR
jgi:hypothetical protein